MFLTTHRDCFPDDVAFRFWSWELLKRVFMGWCQSTEGSRLVKERWRRNWDEQEWGAYVVVSESKAAELPDFEETCGMMSVGLVEEVG